MDKSKTTEPVRRLTDQEIADLRADMQQAAEWTRKELARRRQDKATAPSLKVRLQAPHALTQSVRETLLSLNHKPRIGLLSGSVPWPNSAHLG